MRIMSDHILVINCGSSSLKFALFDPLREQCLIKGVAELLGTSPGIQWSRGNEKGRIELPQGADLEMALRLAAKELLSGISIRAIGHRVVHGAEKFKESALIDDAMLQQVEACNHLAPLHNPANLVGIRVAKQVFGELPHVGVFDTAFHQSIAPQAFLYPIPYELYTELGVRRYGFHGTSHRYVYLQAASLLGKPVEKTAIISAHLGNGCSATASEGGHSRDTTMGMTPLEGLVMGTRSGDVDPGLHGFLCREKGMSIEAVDQLLNKKSGLLGISGLSNDMRELVAAAQSGHARAALALEIFNYRLARSIASLRAAIHDCDAIVFTGGIGENNPWIRSKVIERLAFLGCTIDESKNAIHGRESGGLISPANAALKVMVIPTNEELMIARETLATLGAA
jgi:acetate kinase